MRSFVVERLTDYILDTENDLGVSTQMNCIFAREQLDQVMKLTVAQLTQIENAVIARESYDPTKDKFGFGPVVINATDMLQFLES